MNTIEIKINLDHLLWRTRSKVQDYQFIKIPKSPSINGWFSFFSKVFSNCEPSKNQKNVIGKLILAKKNYQSEYYQFIATCFIDDKYLDFSRRPIKQYLIWFLHSDYDISKIKESLPNDWGKDFISTSKGLYQPFHESSDISKLDKENYIIIERSDDNLQKLQYDDIGEIKYELPVGQSVYPQTSDDKTKKEVEETFEETIGESIKEGVKRALKDCKGKFVGTKLIKERICGCTDEEGERLLKSLAESFGGSTKDQFIKKRVEECSSITFKLISNKPTKGFELIINAFRKYKKHEILLDLDENEGKKFVYECIKEGASANDECIRNIYLRLKELAKQDRRK